MTRRVATLLLLSAVAMGQQGVIGDPPPRMPCPANPVKGQVCYWDGYAWMQEPDAGWYADMSPMQNSSTMTIPHSGNDDDYRLPPAQN